MKMTLLKRTNGQPVVSGQFGDWMDNLLTETGLGNVFHDGLGFNGFQGYPAVNIHESKEAYSLELAAPGFDKSDFNLSLEGNLLTISAEKKQAQENNQKNQVRQEFGYQSFKRSFTVDEQINVAAINAKYENGILMVTLPKQEIPAEAVKTIPVA
jgi:HSP20 family protein